MANTFNANAHPFFAINLTRNFEVDSDELRAFVKAMPNWKFVELEGFEADGTELDVMFIWYHSEQEASRCIYDSHAFVDFMDMVGFNISPEDVIVVCNYPAFTCECCNGAPILPLEEMSRIEGIYGNVDNKQLYVQKTIRRQLAHSQTI